MSDKKRVLVTGGAGYIGSHIVLSLLLTKKYKVFVIDNYTNSYPTALKRVEELAGDKIEAYNIDLRDRSAVDKVFEGYKADGGVWGVIHVAASKAVGESGEIPLEYYENNVSATIALMQVMKKYNVTNFVYSSSATVYGTPPTIPIPETTPYSPESVYGRTKYFVEQIVKDYCHAAPDFSAISLRYFNPAGAHESGRMGEDPRGKPGNLLPLLAQLAIGHYANDGLKVFGNDYPTRDGTCVRDYIHVMDLSQGHVIALDALINGKTTAGVKISGFKAYNLGKGRGMSVMEIIAAVEKVSGYKFKYDLVGRRLGDVPDLTADPALAEQELGFKATRDLETMTRDLWNWQSKNPNGYERDTK